MIALNLPEKTARNLLYCLGEVFDNTFSDKFKAEIIEDKMRIKRAMCRATGRLKSEIVDFQLDGFMKKYGYEKIS